MIDKTNAVYKPVITKNGIVKIDGVTVGKLTPRKTLQICDKDKSRAARRGTRFVEVSLCDLQTLCDTIEQANNETH